MYSILFEGNLSNALKTTTAKPSSRTESETFDDWEVKKLTSKFKGTSCINMSYVVLQEQLSLVPKSFTNHTLFMYV